MCYLISGKLFYSQVIAFLLSETDIPIFGKLKNNIQSMVKLNRQSLILNLHLTAPELVQLIVNPCNDLPAFADPGLMGGNDVVGD